MKSGIKQRSPKPNSFSFVLELGKVADPKTGKLRRRQKRVTVEAKNSTEADKIRTRMQHEINTGIFVVPKTLTVSDYLEQWLKDYAWPNLSPRTAEGYEYVLRHYISPSIGQIALTALKPEQLQAFYTAKLKAGLSNRTVRYCHVVLHKALKSALRMGMIARNPCDATEPPKVQRREMSVMTESDIHLFLEFARSTPYYALFYTLLFTGLRRSEALALQWENVDLLLCKISVTRTIHELRYGDHKGQIIYKEPKSAKSRRLIDLTPSNAVVLREHLEARKKHLKSVNPKFDDKNFDDEELVFCNHDGSPYLPDSITHAWRHLADKVGLKEIRLHDSRHSHASHMLKQNVHPAIVAQRLGHSSVQVTMDVYSHILPGLQKQAAANFDDFLLGNKKSVTKK